ncbi:MAG: Crp/Fnr family transcriptional regulator [Xanthobacteraceae bacterium]
MLLNEVLPHPAETPYIGSAGATSAAKARCPTCDFQKLSFCSALSGNDGERPVRATHETIAGRRNIYRAGKPNEGVQVVCDGWAVRFIQLPSGRHQILSVIMPGDLISPAVVFERQFSFSVQAVTRVHFCTFPFAEVRARLRDNPALFDLWIQLTAAAHRDADRRLVDLGQRTAQERIAGLLVHVMLRSQEHGEVHDDEFPLPMNQQQIADFTGLTPVHTCRVLSALRKTRLRRRPRRRQSHQPRRAGADRDALERDCLRSNRLSLRILIEPDLF